MNLPADPATLRRICYALLIIIAVAGISGRILGTGRVYEPWEFKKPGTDDPLHGDWPTKRPEPQPTHGANDRSRWATVRALVENGTYAIGTRPQETTLASAVLPLAADDPLSCSISLVAGYQTRTKSDRGITFEDGWGTIDKVLNPETQEFYSSKPPLLSTLVAGEYWLLYKAGLRITDDKERWLVVPIILLTFNALPFAIGLILLARLAERYGTSDWSRLFVVAAGAFGTFLIPFATTLNNHSVAASSAMFALYAAHRIWSSSSTTNEAGPIHYLVAGFFATFTACNDLPAASFAAALFLILLWFQPKRTLMYFLPAALLPVAASFLTTYLATSRLLPTYSEFGGPWYEFEGAYWKLNPNKPLAGIDGAGYHEERWAYALHLLIGHHGIFSLTPIFLLAFAGMFISLRHLPTLVSRSPARAETRTRWLGALLALGVTMVVLAWYLSLDERKRNYGGFTSGPRWLFWLTPLWLVAMIPVVDWLARWRWGRVLGYAFLAVSVLSVSYPQFNPWRHPWLYNLLKSADQLPY
jgi:hypothetical protein